MEGASRPLHLLLLVLAISLHLHHHRTTAGLTKAPRSWLPAGNASTTWRNSDSSHQAVLPDDHVTIRLLVSCSSRNSSNPYFAFGFYCSPRPCADYLLAVFIAFPSGPTRAQVVWSANRNTPVKENATLELSRLGGLNLRDANGSIVWWINKSRIPVESLKLLPSGNLVLLGANGRRRIWQSFDHPTDTLLAGQGLAGGVELAANASASNSSRGRYYINHTQDGFRAFNGSTNAPVAYIKFTEGWISLESPLNVCSLNVSAGSLVFSGNTSRLAPAAQFLRLESDGRVRLYQWNGKNWLQTEQLLSRSKEEPFQKKEEGPKEEDGRVKIRIGILVGVTVAVLLVPGILLIVRGTMRALKEEEELVVLQQLPGMPERFSHEDLRVATDNFSRKLGSGGFGSVFDGTLGDGTRVAVKKLENVRHGEREFLAEVETIGNIHHMNLVKLVGFCVEKSHRLLVYEYMRRGSLDKWIFAGAGGGAELPWDTRVKIIHDIARGLLYLHEECLQKIAHLDIKPQNILLDEGFNAKISDFGLAKLIDRDKSGVVTMLRGTPGYMAPEWLISIITEKVDVYSFGVVIAEMVCGMKNLDPQRPSDRVHLLNFLKEKAKADQLPSVLDETRCGGAGAERMLKLALWCARNEAARRPSISMVVKALDDQQVNISEDMYYEYTAPWQILQPPPRPLASGSGSLLSSLSGPR